MDIKRLFNIALLAISLTTIFITLISYIIFKLRQAVSLNKTEDKNKIDGTFFRRFSPLLEKENELQRLEEAPKRERGNRKSKILSLAVFLFAILMTIFIFEDFFSYRNQIKSRIKSAKEYRALIKKGLLRSYVYDPSFKASKIKYLKTNSMKAQYTYLNEALKNEKFCLYSTKRANEYNTNFHNQAKKLWIDFFKRNKFNYAIRDSITNDESCIHIFPHLNALSKKEKEIIENVKLKKIITGSFGNLDKRGTLVKNSYFNKLFNTKKSPESSFEPVILSRENRFLWDLPSGLFLDWKNLDKDYGHLLSPVGDILNSDYNAKAITEKHNDQILFRSKVLIKDNSLWTSLDPGQGKNLFIKDLVFFNLISYVSKTPVFKVSSWRGEKRDTIINFRVDNYIDTIDDFLELIKDKDYSLNVFLDHNLLNSVLPKIDEYQNIDYAIQSKDDDRLFDLTNREVFEFLEKSRLDIEETTSKRVLGFSPHKERMNSNLIAGLEQNKFKYFFGGKHILSRSPIKISKNGLYFYPRVDKSGKELIDNRLIVTKSDFLNTFNLMKLENDVLGGFFVLSFSNSDFQNSVFKKALLEFLEENDLKTTTFDTVVENISENEKIKINYEGKRLKIENSSTKDLNNIIILNRVGNKLKEHKIDILKAKEKIFL